MRNSSLVEQFCAEDVTGLSLLPKLWIWKSKRRYPSGRGALFVCGRKTGRFCGGQRGENAGVSSEMQVRILHTRCPRIPGEGSSALGQSEANVKAKAKADAKQVNIPVP